MKILKAIGLLGILATSVYTAISIHDRNAELRHLVEQCRAAGINR